MTKILPFNGNYQRPFEHELSNRTEKHNLLFLSKISKLIMIVSGTLELSPMNISA